MNPSFLATQLQILIVEDHPDIGRLLYWHLNRLGHKATIACDLQDARKSLQATRWDILICDKSLPDGNGWDLLGEIGEDRGPMYAVAMSAAATTREAASAAATGFSRHLAKPFDLTELNNAVNEALHLRAHAAGGHQA
jgi:DNA-binding NtrC family response regulator